MVLRSSVSLVLGGGQPGSVSVLGLEDHAGLIGVLVIPCQSLREYRLVPDTSWVVVVVLGRAPLCLCVPAATWWLH